MKLNVFVRFLARKTPLRGSLLYFKRNYYKPKTQKFIIKPTTKNEEKELLHEELLNSLPKCRTVKEQIELFCSLVRIPQEDINLRHSICQNLEKNLKPYFSSCSIHLVGSSINDLGFRGCDVDLSMQLPVKNSHKNIGQENVHTKENYKEVKYLANRVFPSKNELLTIRKILQGLNYEEPLTVIPGRCPILNFYVQNLSCDLAINNNSAIHGTMLMLLCGKLDERFKPLMQTIIYWAKQSKIVGGPLKFKTYAIFLMMVYFLQTRSPPVLPPVETMFKKTEFLNNLENWAYDVTQYLDKFEESKNDQTVEALLKEFFLFYGNYDFSYIICPFSGSAVDRKSFAEKIDCKNKFELNTVSIQDPLNLSWNVTTGVSWKHCKDFSKAVISVWEKYQDKNYWIPSSQPWGLTALINSQFSYNSLIDIKEFSIDIPLTVNSHIQNNSTDFMQQTANNLKYILSHCLLFQCYAFNLDMNFNKLEIPLGVKTAVEKLLTRSNPSSNLTQECHVPGANNLNEDCAPYLVSQYIVSTRDTWSGRNTFMTFFDSAKDVFDIEHEISKKMSLDRGATDKDTFYFLCECYACSANSSQSFSLKLKPLNNDRFIPKLAVFLKEYIPKFMGKMCDKSQDINEER